MKKIAFSLITLFLLLTISGCVKKPVKSQLQIREFQTKVFNTGNTEKVMKAMLNVLQDDDYIIKNAVLDLGIINAEKVVDIETFAGVMITILTSAGTKKDEENEHEKIAIINCSVNVTPLGKDRVKIRVNFLKQKRGNKGGLMDVTLIDDPKFYKEFFSKVEKGLFLEEQKL